MSNVAAFHAIVHGRVQGVGFRWFTVYAAERNGVSGWVRNCRDRTVEVEASGPREALEAFLEDLHQGPASAHVTEVSVDWLPTVPEHGDFHVTH